MKGIGMQSILSLILGCRYMYLFAADDSEEKSLIKYYRDKLSFKTVSELDADEYDDSMVVPIMPFYDYTCEFMISKI